MKDTLSYEEMFPPAPDKLSYEDVFGAEPPKPSGILRRVGDQGIKLAQGVIGVPEAAVGLANLVTGGHAGKAAEDAGIRFKDAKGILGEYLSPEQQAADKAVQDAEGFFPTIGAMVKNPSTILGGAMESAPSTLAGGVAARGIMAGLPYFAPKMAAQIAAAEAAPFVASQGARTLAKVAPIAAGAAGEGLVTAGANAEQVRQQTPDGLLTPEQSAIIAASGGLTGLIGFGAGKIANKLGIGDVQTMLARGKLGAVGADAEQAAAQKGLLRKIGEGFANEGILQELPQSYQEQVAQNLALGKPWDQGAAEAGAQGMMAGGLLGMGGNAVSHFAGPGPDQTGQQSQTPPSAPPTTPPNAPPSVPQTNSPGSPAGTAGTAGTPQANMGPISQAAAAGAGAGSASGQTTIPPTIPQNGVGGIPQNGGVDPNSTTQAPQQSGDDSYAKNRAIMDDIPAGWNKTQQEHPASTVTPQAPDQQQAAPDGAPSPVTPTATAVTPTATAVTPAATAVTPTTGKLSDAATIAVNNGAHGIEKAKIAQQQAEEAKKQGASTASGLPQFTAKAQPTTLGQSPTTVSAGPGFGIKDVSKQAQAPTAQEQPPAQPAQNSEQFIKQLKEQINGLEVGDSLVNDMGDSFAVETVIRNKQGDVTGIVTPPVEGGKRGTLDVDQIASILTSQPYTDVNTGERKMSAPGSIQKAKPATATTQNAPNAAQTVAQGPGATQPTQDGAAPDAAAWQGMTPEQRRRSVLEQTIATGTENNGGVMVKLRPSAIEDRKQQLAAMGDAGKMTDAQPTATPNVEKTGTNQQALDRIASGKAWFGNELKAKNWVHTNELAETHEVQMTAPRRFEVVPKKQDTENQVTAKNETTTQQNKPEQTVNTAVAATKDVATTPATQDQQVESQKEAISNPVNLDGAVSPVGQKPAAAQTAEKLPAGWTESALGRLATSDDPATGGMVDTNVVTGKWFAISNATDGRIPGEFNTRAEAIEALGTQKAAQPAAVAAPKPTPESAQDPLLNKLAAGYGYPGGSETMPSGLGTTARKLHAAIISADIAKAQEILHPDNKRSREAFEHLFDGRVKLPNTVKGTNDTVTDFLGKVSTAQRQAGVAVTEEFSEPWNNQLPSKKEDGSQKPLSVPEKLRAKREANQKAQAASDQEAIEKRRSDIREQSLENAKNNADTGATESNNANTLQTKPVSKRNSRETQADAPAGNRDSESVGAGVAENSAGTAGVGGVPASTHQPGGPGARGTEQSGVEPSSPARDSAGVRTEPVPTGSNEQFVIDGEDIGKGGLTKKYRDNIAAIKILKALDADGRVATPDERKQLAKYVGWGALKGPFDPENKQWSKEHAELKELLTEAEFKAARRSTLDAHYTSPIAIGAMYDAMERLGFTGGRVLEPSVGSGNFFGLMPRELRNASQLHGVELDALTSKLVSALYPEAKIAKSTGFEDFEIPSEFFDAVIGNPPFGNQPLVDKERSAYSGFSIHNYFLAKGIDKLRPGGVMAVVVSHNFLDAQDDRARKWISERANLLGAVRLPNTAFKENAGTEVVTDILVFQKKSTAEYSNRLANDTAPWLKVVDQKNINPKTGEAVTHKVNEFFANRPGDVLGTPTAAGSMYSANEYTIEPTGDLKQQLAGWVKALPSNVFTPIDRTSDNKVTDMAVPDGVKVGSYYIDDGRIMQRGEDVMGDKTATVWTPPNEKAAARMRGMIALRDTLRQQMRLERSADATTDEIEKNRTLLNRQYDEFLKKYGHINNPTNRRIFLDDIESQLIQALEFDYDKGISKEVAEREEIEPRDASAVKADIFNRRVAFPPQDFITVESSKDALLASLNYRGKIDTTYMEEVFNKPAAEIVKELGDVVFYDPQHGLVTADEYLSGDVKTKLAEAQAAAKDNPDYKRNVAALEKVIPADKKPSEISASIGASFVPAEMYQQFVKHISGGDATVFQIKATGQWMVDYKGQADTALNTGKFGTKDLSAQELFQLSMLGRGAVVKQIIKNPDGSTTTLLLEKETEAAREKQNAIKAEWQKWLWQDPERSDKIASIYNEKMNRIVDRKYDGSHMTFPGMNPAIIMLEHQKNGVWRGLQSRQVLYDHVVGAGKTFQLAALAMEMRRLGISRKPLFVVPNHLTLQWRSEFTRLYPGSNILAATPEDFGKGNRERMFSKIITGDWDAVVIGHSSLKKIGLPEETERAVLQEQIDEISEAVEEMKRGRGDKNIIRDMEKIRANLEAKMKDKLASIGKRDKVVSFDELGIDAMFVDEMHEFKNLTYNSTMDRNPGMGNPAGSAKAFDMFVKTRWLFDTFGDKVPYVTATGTPVSNSLVEMFNMQRYMQYPTLKKEGLHVFDSWAKQFGSVDNVYEVAPSGSGYRQSTRFAKFANLPALMGLYNSFADTVTLDDLKAQEEAQGKRFPVPKVTGGKPTIVVAKRSPMVSEFMGVPRAEIGKDGQVKFGVDLTASISIEQDKKSSKWVAKVGGDVVGTFDTEQDAKIKIVEQALSPVVSVEKDSILGRFANLRQLTKDTKGKVNALSLTGEANKAGLDYRLIDPSAPDFAGSKINLAVEHMVRLHKQWDADKGTQLVFCDMSIPTSARSSYSTKARRLYVLDDNGAVTMKRGTMHTVAGHEYLPFFVVQRGQKDAKRFDVFDAASGIKVKSDLLTKADAIEVAGGFITDDKKRQSWIDAAHAREISQDQIDAYNDENEVETDGIESFTREDIAGISGSAKFSVYDDIKAKLVAKGIPEREIAFIHDYSTPTAKDKLFKAVNAGDVRVLLGSTPKMGAGTNVQKRLVGLHHIDAPWRPSDLEQREGRIIRRDNDLYARDPDGFEVFIGRYATEQTYDTRRWQILEHKARGIEQLRNYDGSLNEIDDIEGEAANSADMKAAASGDPMILQETSLRNEVRRLEQLQAAHADGVLSLTRNARAQKEYAEKYGPRLVDDVKVLLATVKKNPLDAEGWAPVTVNGKVLAVKEKALDEIARVASVVRAGMEEEANIQYRGLEFVFHRPHGSILYAETPTGTLATWSTSDPFSTSGFVQRLKNYVDRLPAILEDTKASVEKAANDAKALLEESRQPFSQAADLARAREDHKKVQRALMAKGPVVPDEQKPLVSAGIAEQKAKLERLGFGEALREFFGAQESTNFSRTRTTRNTTTVQSLQSAIRQTLGVFLGNGLGRVVATTSSEVKSTWEPLVGKTGVDSKDAAGQAQAFYDPKTKTIFLMADRIEAGTEQAVLVHELMHKHGKAVLGQEGWDKLHAAIESWKDAKAGSQERQVYDAAAKRVAAAGAALSKEELFPYAVEEAIKLGIKPNILAPQGTVAKWLAQVKQLLRQVWDKLVRRPDTFNAQDMVNMAFGIAQRENAPGFGLDTSISWDSERLDRLMSQYAYPSNDKKTKAFAAWVSPQDFLAATTPQGYAAVLEGEAKDLDAQELKRQVQEIYLEGKIGHGKFVVTGHEGRHRMVALARAGVKRVPVVFYTEGSATENATKIDELRATPQKWAETSAERGFRVENLTPISWAYFDELSSEFASNADIRYSRATFAATANKAASTLSSFLSHPGTVSGWWKTVGSMYGLAQKYPEFKPVFDAGQRFLNDVSFYATEAATLAPTLLPKLESIRDIFRTAIPHKDNKPLADALFQGTLSWKRDAAGKLEQTDKVDEAGVIFSDDELKSTFGMNDRQVGLYREARAAIDNSLDNTAKAAMVQLGGKEMAYMRDMVMGAPSAGEAAHLLTQELVLMGSADPTQSARFAATATDIQEVASRINQLKKRGYAPLSRFGRYTVSVRNGTKQEYFGLFESKREANTMADKMRGLHPGMDVKQGTLSQKEFEQYQGITPETAELFGEMLGLDQAGPLAKEAFQEYLRMVKNNRSALKRLIHRKGIAGYNEDVGRVLSAFIASNARKGASDLHLGDMSLAVSSIPQDMGELKDIAIGLQKYLVQPQEEAPAMRGMLFAQYIGGSVASAMVNLTQPMQVSMPYLSQFGGAKKATAALAGAYRDMATKGYKYAPQLDAALKIAEEEGIVAPQEIHQLQAQARGAATLRSGDGTPVGELLAMSRNGFTRLMLGWGKMFGLAEQVNRRATFIAAFRMAQEQGITDPAKFASKAVNETQFVNNKGNRMMFGRGPIGAVVMTFKSYGLNYLELLHRLATQDGTDGKYAAALMIGMLMLMAGAGGLPFEDDLHDLIDAIAQRMGYNISSNRAKQKFLEETFGKAAADFIDKGITGLPGVPIDMSLRMGMGNMIPGTGLLLQKRDHTRDVLELAGPAGDFGKRLMEGVSKLADGKVGGAILDVAPRAVSSAAQGVGMLNKGYYSDTHGRKVIDTTTGEGLAKIVGFQPQSVAADSEKTGFIQRMKDTRAINSGNFAEMWAKGIYEGDPQQVQDAQAAIRDWNEKNPDTRITPNIPAILRRVREMRKTRDQRMIDSSPKAMRAQVRRELMGS